MSPRRTVMCPLKLYKRRFLRKQAEHEAFLAAKRKRKADMAREVMADEDNIFGGADGSAAKPMEVGH